MPEELKVYALDEGKNNFQTMTKEQILSAINQKISSGSIVNIDDAFITKIKEMNAGALVQLWIGTQAEFEALSEKQDDTLYILSDDPTVNEIESSISSLEQSVNDIGQNNTYLNEMYNRIINGQQAVYRAKYASSDTSKGTIDERLDALGFKEGVITETENFTITDYTLYRRSKIVTFQIKGYPINNLNHQVWIKIPQGFAPKNFEPIVQGLATVDELGQEDEIPVNNGEEGGENRSIRFVYYPETRQMLLNLTHSYFQTSTRIYWRTFDSGVIGWEVADDE